MDDAGARVDDDDDDAGLAAVPAFFQQLER